MPTQLADIKAHTGADNRPASCSLRSTSTPKKMGEAFVALSPWRFARRRPPTGTNSLRSLEPSPYGRGCLATASLIHSAPPLRYRLHTSGRRTAPTICALTSATIQGLYDIRIKRHHDTSTQAPPHTPSAARRHTTPLRLPWRSLMQGRAVIPHQSKTFIRPTTHCRGRGSYGRAFRLGCIAPAFITALWPQPPAPRALPPPPRLPRPHPDVLPGYVNDAAESEFAGI